MNDKVILIMIDNAVRRSKWRKKFILGPSDVQIIPGRKPYLKRLRSLGYRIVGLSHQSGIETIPNFHLDSFLDGLKLTNDMLGASRFEKIYWSCTYLPAMTDSRLIGKARDDLNFRPSKCLIVGRNTNDEFMAETYGIAYTNYWDFFSRLPSLSLF
jgi:histidinol phosphatase-like enzyme